MFNNDYGMMGFGGGFMWIFWIFTAVVLVWIVKGGFEAKNLESQSALDILKARYARGDISKEEFEQKRKDLTK
ncbi:MAG: SHOCT domain-containing protein [Candidatus Thioglobus sp.]|nr:SHOCT domain-containing protein [Candidatus Thioglobus pontius]MBL6976989.1 SHOCT domain-containing protein [Candidatus Thioglobus sp.]MBL6984765.1 SHOCT domain-containing protein [Candidatus Thioglobus sp.]